jgi:hypothetical protein
MADETHAPSTITEELGKMGKLVAQAVQAAWESEERRKLEAELAEGLRKFSEEVSTATKKAGESDAAKQIKFQAEKVASEVKERDIAEEVRKGLLTGLGVINLELGKLIERLEPRKPEPMAETPAEPVVETTEPPQEG